jgi:hypothetical protein
VTGRISILYRTAATRRIDGGEKNLWCLRFNMIISERAWAADSNRTAWLSFFHRLSVLIAINGGNSDRALNCCDNKIEQHAEK